MAVNRISQKRTTVPWSQGGPTDDSAWRQGGGDEYRRGGTASRGGYDELTAAGESGSGAAVAIARKRQELALAALENAAARESIEGQDLDGSGREMVARGRQQQAELQDVTVHQPRMQAERNRLTALEGASKRDEWGKTWDTMAPAREHEETIKRIPQTIADIRAGSARDVADITGNSRVDAAEATAGGRVDASRLGALGRGAAAFEGQGQHEEARQMMDQVEPMSQIQNSIINIQNKYPELTPEQYLDLLGDDLTPEERAEAERILGGQA